MIDWVESPNLNKSFCSDFSVHSENLTSLLINLKTWQDPKVWMKAQMMPLSGSKIQYLRSIPHASSHYCMNISTEIIPYLVQICFWHMIWLLHFPTSSLVIKDPQIQLLHWSRVQVANWPQPVMLSNQTFNMLGSKPFVKSAAKKKRSEWNGTTFAVRWHLWRRGAEGWSALTRLFWHSWNTVKLPARLWFRILDNIPWPPGQGLSTLTKNNADIFYKRFIEMGSWKRGENEEKRKGKQLKKS